MDHFDQLAALAPRGHGTGRELFYLDLNGAMMGRSCSDHAQRSAPANRGSCSTRSGGRHRAAEPTT